MAETIPHHALVLAAGLGTRLRPLTLVRTKAAIPVAGEPIARRILAWLSSQGVRHVAVNLHHLPQTLTAVLGDGSDLDVEVRYSWEQPDVLGSAGGPRQALGLIGAETFWIINGDTLTDLDLASMAERHAAAGALVTLALAPNRQPERYGGVKIDDRARVVGFARRGTEARGSHHFLGVQIVSAEVFRALPERKPANSIGGVYDALVAARPGTIAGHLCDAAFWDIGTVSDYLETSRAFARAEGHPGVVCGRETIIHPTARVADSILWDDIEVGPRCHLADCIVTDGVRVPAGSEYRRATLVRVDLGRPSCRAPVERGPQAFPITSER